MEMTTHYLTPNQQKELKKNPYVKAVSEKAITYTDEFKRLFISENEAGKLPRQIFEEAGFDIEMIGMTRVHKSAERWRTAYKNQGVTGLEDTRKYSSGRTLDRELSLEEKYARLEAKARLLEAENELLKKLDLLERQMMTRKPQSKRN
jgi:transposase